ncbi:arylacetamide deacetylase-like [Saccoglossus kowalevskii]
MVYTMFSETRRRYTTFILLITSILTAWYVYVPVPEEFEEPWKLRLVETTGRTIRHLAVLGESLGMGDSVKLARRLFDIVMLDYLPSDSNITMKDTSVSDVPIRIYAPIAMGTEPLPAIVFLHGGGWTIGGVKMHHDITKTVSSRLGIIVISVEVPHDEETEIYLSYVDPDSLPDKFKPDDYKRHQPVTVNQTLWNEVKDVMLNSTFSPLLKHDLKGLPNAYIMTVKFDVLRDEGVLYAQRLENAGVPVDLRYYEHGFHGCFNLHEIPGFHVSKVAMEDFLAYAAENL